MNNRSAKWTGTEGERSPITKGPTKGCGAFVGAWLGGRSEPSGRRWASLAGIEGGGLRSVRMASGVKRREGKGEARRQDAEHGR